MQHLEFLVATFCAYYSCSRDKEQLGLLHHQFIESNKANESLRKELAIYDHVLKLEQTQWNDVDGKSCL